MKRFDHRAYQGMETVLARWIICSSDEVATGFCFSLQLEGLSFAWSSLLNTTKSTVWDGILTTWIHSLTGRLQEKVNQCFKIPSCLYQNSRNQFSNEKQVSFMKEYGMIDCNWGKLSYLLQNLQLLKHCSFMFFVQLTSKFKLWYFGQIL